MTGVLEAMVGDTTNRRFRVIKHYLGATRGLDFDGEEARLFQHQQKLARVVATAAAPWIATELQAFHTSMLMRRQKMLDAGRTRGALPMTYDSLLLAIKYARWLLNASHELGATSSHSVTQTMVEAYVAAHPKTFQTLAAVVRYLNRNRQRFQPLELPTKAPVRSSIHLRVSHQQRSELVRTWLAANEGMTLRNSCVALLCMFYLQKPYQVLALRQRDLQRDGASVSIDLGTAPRRSTWISRRCWCVGWMRGITIPVSGRLRRMISCSPGRARIGATATSPSITGFGPRMVWGHGNCSEPRCMA